ncbi:HU family DNA-binding protein [uncultured Faecalicoccus sp.]|uniref:HU family DNA-binding protein n=1 Tax=uncultured Faecalicoccus sp. TaxID=1971760 RepID=UPI0025E7C557|nr:HU family DNA-binding protein [uncultured Faecalicoccus sp.]
MAKFVNKESLTETVYNELKLSRKDAGHAVELIFKEIMDALAQEGEADIAGFGKFVIFDRKERMGINPVTKEKMVIHATKLPKFKPSISLKKICNSKDI